MKILGIETSCDETAAAIVTSDKKIISNIVLSQIDEHQPYGGVVPEIASRAHIMHIENVIKKALGDTDIKDIDGIAVTSGPGLIGGVIVGLMVAKGIASATGKPLIGVNHLEGHALTARLTNDVEFPFLLLLVSGGHCQILVAEGVGKYKLLGQTLDDALGEAFDKTSKMLGLGYPGGPIVEKHALDGDPLSYKLPLPMVGRKGCDFSFSGLKTAVRKLILQHPKPNTNQINDICASFQKTCGDIIEDRMNNAIRIFINAYPEAKTIVLAGGVAANKYIGGRLNELCQKHNLELIAPPLNLCTDNAVMIAWAGLEYMRLDVTSPMDITPRARWSLTEN